MKIGDSVIYVDTHGVEQEALVTFVHSEQCINIIYVSDDPTRQDSFGRQIVRESSVSVQGPWCASGRYFRVKTA
jgi:hypothetical protein